MVEDIVLEDGSGLQNICFSPMSYDDDIPTINACAIQSLLGYFENDLAEFNSSESTYISTIYGCLL